MPLRRPIAAASLLRADMIFAKDLQSCSNEMGRAPEKVPPQREIITDAANDVAFAHIVIVSLINCITHGEGDGAPLVNTASPESSTEIALQRQV